MAQRRRDYLSYSDLNQTRRGMLILPVSLILG